MALMKSNLPLWNNLSDLFDNDWLSSSLTGNWAPSINVIDNDSNYEIEVAVPGLKKEDFNVSIENNVLTISGKTEKEEEEKKKNYTRKEFSSRSFTKSFTLPNNVEQDDMKAKYNDGILTVTVAKTEAALPSKKELAIE